MKKAIVLLSGGLDSATVLYWARAKGYKCLCLTFDYGQRHKKEIGSAVKIASSLKCPVEIIKIRFPWKGSSLFSGAGKIPVPGSEKKISSRIPSTYVPARNTVFLSFALSYAESAGLSTIFIGANAVDFSGYPDCRPEYFRIFNKLSVAGTKCGIKGKPVSIKTPLIGMSKSQIARLALKLGVPVGSTWSCYRGGRKPCGKCDACLLREKGFREAGLKA